MKTITVLAVALGLGSLAACNQSPQAEATDNLEANAEAAAEVVDENAAAPAEAMDANAAAPAADANAAAPAADANAG